METQERERQHVTLDIEPEPAAMEARRPEVVKSIDEPRGKSLAVERVIVRYSDQVNELFAAMAEAQGEFEDLERTRVARITSTRANYAFEYETLADVIAATKAALSKAGLCVMQFPFPGQHSLTLRTWVGHKSGQWVYNDLTATIDGTDPKSVSSGITYLCRYARKAILGIAAEWDDDAESASPKAPPPQAAPRRSQQRPPEPENPEHVEARREAETVAASPVHAGPKLVPQPVGRIIDSKEDGTAYGVVLETGYKAGTRDADLVRQLKAYKASGATVELVCRPPAKAGYAPVIMEISLRRREPGADDK